MVTICTLLWFCFGCKYQAESEKGKHLSRTGWNGAGFVKVPKCDMTHSGISHFAPEWLATLLKKKSLRDILLWIVLVKVRQMT